MTFPWPSPTGWTWRAGASFRVKTHRRGPACGSSILVAGGIPFEPAFKESRGSRKDQRRNWLRSSNAYPIEYLSPLSRTPLRFWTYLQCANHAPGRGSWFLRWKCSKRSNNEYRSSRSGNFLPGRRLPFKISQRFQRYSFQRSKIVLNAYNTARSSRRERNFEMKSLRAIANLHASRWTSILLINETAGAHNASFRNHVPRISRALPWKAKNWIDRRLAIGFINDES